MDRSAPRTLERPDHGELMLAGEESAFNEMQPAPDSPLLVVLSLLLERRAQLARATLASLVVAALIAFLIPRSYDSTVQLMPPDSASLEGGAGMIGALMGGVMGSGGSTAGSGIASGIGEMLGGQRPGALFVGVLGCRTIADRLIDRFDLRKVYWRKTYVSARRMLASRTNINEDRKTGIIEITVSDHDRQRAAALAQAYVDELNQLLSQVNNSAASRERAFLEQRLGVVHKELQDASQALSEFSSQNATLNPEDQGRAMVEAAAALQGQLIAAQSELSGLEQIYSPENVRVRSLKAHISELEQEINKFGGKNYSGSTTLGPDALYPSLRQLPVLGMRYADLYGRVKIDETVFALLTEEYEMARVEEAKQTPSVKVLDAAKVAERASWPPRFLLTFAGGMLGLFFSSCWVVVVELWNELDPNQPYKKLSLEVWNAAKASLSQRTVPILLRFRHRSPNHSSDQAR